MNTIEAAKFIFDLVVDKKEVYLVGETHLYNEEESEWGRNLLEKEGIKDAFFEGSDSDKELGLIGGTAFRIITQRIKLLALRVGRTSKTLLKLCDERGIRVLRLEKDKEIPIHIQISLLVMCLAICVVPVCLLIRIMDIERGRKRGEGLIMKVSTDFVYGIDKRNKIMVDTMKEYLKDIDSPKVLIVCGLCHFEGMTDLIKKNFNVVSICKIR
jgi:hypothetical protein